MHFEIMTKTKRSYWLVEVCLVLLDFVLFFSIFSLL